MGPITLALITIVLSLLGYLAYRINESTKYWLRKGIPHRKPLPILGNSGPILLRKSHFIEIHLDIMKQFPNEPVIGVYDFGKPVLLIKDLDIVEKVMVKDFMHFTDRGFPVNRDNPLDISLFTMNGKEWRALRYKLSPLFTTTKLKSLYGMMIDVGDNLSALMDQISENEDIDLKEYLGMFAMDVIGSCAYGIDAKNLQQPDNDFRKMAKKSFDFGLWRMLDFILLMAVPKLAKLLGKSFVRKDVGIYFSQIIRDTIEYRRTNNVVRNDFLQMFMSLKDKGSMEFVIKDPADDYLRMETPKTTEIFEFTDDLMIGNAFTFLNAGFDATASTTLFTIYELAKNQELQEKARKEILKHVQEAGGSMTYDALRKMVYLEQCVKEALRKYSPAPLLSRVCNKEYTLPNGYTIPVGESIAISARAIHYDPTIFPDPEEFRPERFDPDQNLPSCAFMPFGNGPRMCIAMRFALMQVNFCIAVLLMKHKFTLSPRSEPFRLTRKSFLIAPETPILFNVCKLKLAS